MSIKQSQSTERKSKRQRSRGRFRFTSAAKAESVAAELESMRLKEAAKVVLEGFAETLAYCEMPREHWRRIRTNNAIERLNREIRRRTASSALSPMESRPSCWWPPA